ncbi:uncharacterized protein LOC144163895 [Haemaphysalis longicornis]
MAKLRIAYASMPVRTCIQEGACSSLDSKNYVLPPTPVGIAHNLAKAIKRSDVRLVLRRRIAEWLCHDLFRYTLYPGKLYRQVVRHLVQRHPFLRDKDSWYQRLRYKRKFERTKLLDAEEVADKRKKFWQKRRQTVRPSAGTTVEARTNEILDNARDSSMEDQEVLTILAFLTTLPRAAKEKSSTLLKEKAPWFIKHPLVVWNGDLEGPIGACTVHIEDQLVNTSHPVEAILLAFCLHWVVDLVYQITLKSFYNMIEHLLGLDATKATPTVLRVLSALMPQKNVIQDILGGGMSLMLRGRFCLQ